MLILCFENSTFGVVISLSGRICILLVIGGSGRTWSEIWRVRLGRVGSGPMDISSSVETGGSGCSMSSPIYIFVVDSVL